MYSRSKKHQRSSQQAASSLRLINCHRILPRHHRAMLVQLLAARLGAEVIETHLSWVLLTDDLAYKIKKPVRLPFVDYGTLAARRRCCEEELRLNRRLAPALYLSVVPIIGPVDDPRVGGTGEPIEWAVCMRRFGPRVLFSQRLEDGTLRPVDIDACAERLVRFHTQAEVALPGAGLGGPDTRRRHAEAALAGAAPVATPEEHEGLGRWLHEQAQSLGPLWLARGQLGRVRECHGDLHLSNLIAEDGRFSAFDGIEFDPALRWIDVLDDIAFPVMDLHARGRCDFAFRLLNAWLDGTGDHAGLAALRFSLVYRALVRAQVEWLQGRTHEARRYLEAALQWTLPRPRWLAIMHGLPGSGKTFVSQQMLERHGAIRLRSDVERKRLFGLAATADSRAQGVDIYAADVGRRTYDRLLDGARCALRAGFGAILDAAYLRREERDAAASLARQEGVFFGIVPCEAPDETLRTRLRERRGDASEADETTLALLRSQAQPLGKRRLSTLLTRS